MPEGFILVRVLRVRANDTIYPTATEASTASYDLATTEGGEYAVVHQSYEVDESSSGFDWEELLRKYMLLVLGCEGITFATHASAPFFDADELAALTKMHDTVCGWRE